MSPEQFLEQFGYLADAPNGIARLRELVLQLAVRGTLVEQDPNDEPASVLLEKIQIKKERLIKEEGLRTKAKTEINPEEEYINRPTGWGSCRLGNLAKFIDYRGRTPKKIESGVPLITAKNVRFGLIAREPQEFISDDEYEVWMTRGFPKNGDILFTTEAPLGNVAIVDIKEKFALAQRVICFQLHEPDIAPFLKTLMMSQAFLKQLADRATGMTAKGIKSSKLKELPVPIPPLVEQHRIVSKVDQLMALCDELEAKQNHRTETHSQLLRAAHHHLTEALKPAAFQTAWHRIRDHFDHLYTTPEAVKALRQTILQLAVQGKLVPQDSSDEPASVLLEKIKAVKDRLIKEKKIKKQKKLPGISEKKKPFDLPVGWTVTQLGNLINLVSGQHLKPHEYTETKEEGMVPYLTGPAEFGDEFPSATRYTYERRALASEGDILITCKGSGVGKLNTADTEIAISRQLMSIQPIIANSHYVIILAQNMNKTLRKKSVGIAIPGISRGDVLEITVRVPPLTEQSRIVAKVNQLMAFCDELETKITTSQTTAEHYAEAITQQIAAA